MTKSIIVTGASVGFGPEIAAYLAERGLDVYAGVADPGQMPIVEEAAGRRNVAVRVVPLDPREQSSVDTAIGTVVAETGGIYGVVNNDNLFMRGYFEDLLDDEIRRIFETNLLGTMAVTRAALPHMRAARRGRIVIITSVAGKIGAPTGSAYSASKFALEGFGESLMQEVAPLGVGVSIIEPGITLTRSWTIDQAAASRARNPESPYHAWFNRAEQLFDRTMRSAPQTPETVAATVHRALTASRPRLRYVVGPRARLIIAARRYAPAEVFERIYFGALTRRITREP